MKTEKEEETKVEQAGPGSRREVRPELIDELVQGCSTAEDLFGPEGVLTRMKGALMERILEAEMTQHLGYDKHAIEGRGTGNNRNGHSRKTVHTESGPVAIRIPRDREGQFTPQLIPKHRRRLEGFDDKVLALYARGMSTRDIQAHLRELYGTEVSPELISRVTDGVLEELKQWQMRPLEACYPIVYLDALFVHVRDSGVVQKKAVYVALGVTLEGQRDVLGLWIEQTEGAKFWLSVLTDLKNRGVQDILFVCCDGLTGFPKAVETAFPKAVVQTCIVHMMRNSLSYVSHADKRLVVNDLRAIYAAENETAAWNQLDAFDERWGAKYPTITRMWKSRWAEVVPFLAYPREVRRILYTTNSIESLNFQLRKVLKPKGAFPTDEAVFKVLFLAIRNAQVHWKPWAYWKTAMAHFAVMFEDRLTA
jgi:putative transposase